MKIPENRNTAIDFGRFICAFLVVALHTRFPISSLSPYLVDVGKIAVPFFLTISGFYLYSEKNSHIYTKAKLGVIKITKITIWATMIYGLLQYIQHRFFDVTVSAQSFNLTTFLLLNDTYFTGHLWYLFAYLYALVAIAILSKLEKIEALLYSTPLLFVIHFTFTIWSRVVTVESGKMLYELNWIVTSLPFLAIGMILKKNSSTITTMNKINLLMTAFMLAIFIFIEHYAFKIILGKGPGVFSVTFLTIVLFTICMQNWQFISKPIDAKIAQWGRDHALNIYIFHVLIREIFSTLQLGLWANNTVSIFIVALILSQTMTLVKNRVHPIVFV